MPKKEAAAAPALTAELLAFIKERATLLERMTKDKEREMELRLYLAKVLVPEPVEGAQRLITADGYEVCLTHKINRRLDAAMVDDVMAELPEGCPARSIGVLIDYKPSLVLDGYRTLPSDQLAIVQQMITETDGAPDLDIMPIVDHSAGKAKDGTLGNAINKANAPAKPEKTKAGKAKKKK